MELLLQRPLVFFCTSILRELNGKGDDGANQKRVNEAALMQQEFSDKPYNQRNDAKEPEHFQISQGLDFTEALGNSTARKAL